MSEHVTIWDRGARWDTYKWVARFDDRPLGFQLCFQYHGPGKDSRPHATREAAERCAADIIAGRKLHRTERR